MALLLRGKGLLRKPPWRSYDVRGYAMPSKNQKVHTISKKKSAI
jgi:hypothetical protein